MSDCIFCKIARGEMETEFVYQDDQVVAFNDINPQAPVHVLIIPKRHISSLNQVTESDEAVLGRIQRIAAQIAATKGLAEDGYRLVVNCGESAGQSVWHIHYHLLGGRELGWPPG